MNQDGPYDMKLGRYELIEPIAKGGMAQIYRARLAGPAGFEQIFAVKRILPQFSDDETFRRLFINEAKVASLLRHPNIVSVLELGQEQGGLYLVMEYVDGIDLHKLLKILKEQGRWLEPDLIAHVVTGLLKALAYAHSRTDEQGRMLGIVHRDVTPHNTLLTRDGTVKLADFGIAKAAFTTFKTAEGLTRGKLGYMSPEQIRGAKLTGASDLFTVGIMLLELLTGNLRTEGGSPKKLVKETMQGELPTHPGLRDAPAALAELCKRLLAKNPDHRPTATEALAALAASGWDRDRSQDLAALVAQVAPPKASRPKGTAAPRPRRSPKPAPRNGALPPPPPEPVVANGGQSARQATNGAPTDLNPVFLPETMDRPGAPPTIPEAPPAGGMAQAPQMAMEEQPTVILDQAQPEPVSSPPPPPGQAPGPPQAPSPLALPLMQAMEEQPTVILDEDGPVPLSGQEPQPPTVSVPPTTQDEGSSQRQPLPVWRLSLRVGLAAAALLLLVLALVGKVQRKAAPAKPSASLAARGPQSTEPSALPKGRILLLRGKTVPEGKEPARLTLDGALVPKQAKMVAVKPGTHEAAWKLGDRLCARKNILVKPDEPLRLERLRPCPPTGPSGGGASTGQTPESDKPQRKP